MTWYTQKRNNLSRYKGKKNKLDIHRYGQTSKNVQNDIVVYEERERQIER